MSLEKVIVGLRNRVPWTTVMKPILQHCSLKKGHGWEDTIPKLEEFAQQSQEKEQELIETLSNIYQEHLIAGEKSARFFRESQDKIGQIIAAFDTYTIPHSPFSVSYPYALSEEELRNTEEGIFLVKILKLNDKCLLIFCSKRHLKERVEITPEGRDHAIQAVLAEYSEVIGIKEYDRQFFDIVVLDPLNSAIEIRLDIGRNISSDERRTNFKQVKRKLQELISEITNSNYELENAVNLFPVINRLYRSNEGRVCELAFTTEGGSIKHEKMRRRNECLRTEAYHQGGSRAVDGQITAYRIAVTWERITDTLLTQPELLIPGYSRMLSQANISLSDVVITNCANTEDYDFVVKKLNSFLAQDERTT